MFSVAKRPLPQLKFLEKANLPLEQGGAFGRLNPETGKNIGFLVLVKWFCVFSPLAGPQPLNLTQLASLQRASVQEVKRKGAGFTAPGQQIPRREQRAGLM